MKNLEMRNIVIEREEEIKELIEATERKALHPDNNFIYVVYYDLENGEFFTGEYLDRNTYENPSWAFGLLTIEHRYNEEYYEECDDNFTIKDAITYAIADTDIVDYDYESILDNLDKEVF